MKRKVVAVHLLNDYSGSPLVLKQSIEALVKTGYEITLHTSKGPGFLSNIKNVKTVYLPYSWSKLKIVTLINFLYCQLLLFIKLFATLKKADIVYINSLLPFGAAIAAKLRGCKVVYHIHEVSIKPARLKSLLIAAANYSASKGIFVSNDVKMQTGFTKPCRVIYNALPHDFMQQADNCAFETDANNFNVVMACSLKAYKGVFEFVACAERLTAYKFILVLNATKADIKGFFKNTKLPKNLVLYSSQKNMHPFYSKANVVLNLSRPDEWIETFGMTILEAMYYKKPVIIPPVGGVTELVKHCVEGYRVDSSNINELCARINALANDSWLYNELSSNSYKRAKQFSQEAFSAAIINTIENLNFVEDAVRKPDTQIKNWNAIPKNGQLKTVKIAKTAAK